LRNQIAEEGVAMGYQDFRLTVVKGFNKGESYPLEGDEIVIGRGEDNDIVLNVGEVSREHAVLVKQENEEGYIIKDLNSTNGTFVDKMRIGGKYLLKPGDTIMLGDAVYLTYQADMDPDATLVAPAPDAVQDAEETAVTPRQQAARQPRKERAAAPPPPAAVKDLREEQLTEEGGRKTWLWAGIGCLVVVIFLAVVGLIVFDYLNLYCTPPFDTLFDFLYTCPS
jgi:pSer/pThr/pTyr-binding forkhead associated (FHA) protein